MPRLSAFVAPFALLLTHTATAQSTSATEDTVTPVSAVRTPHTNVRILVGLAAATALVMPFDARIQGHFQSNTLQRSSTLKSTAHMFNTAGGVGTVIAPIALYGIGHFFGSPELTKIGVHAGEAVIAGGLVATTLKMAVGRQRPHVQFRDADDFSPGHGLNNHHASLPSGHTTAAFAFASAVSADLRAWHPTFARYTTPLLYGGATLVGLSRMYTNQHWASDVLLGAGIGTLVGHKTIAFGRAHSNNWITRRSQAIHIVPDITASRILIGVGF